MKPPFFRSPYNYDRNQASDESGLVCPEDDRKTQQHQAEEADINVIVKRFGVTGQLPVRNLLPPLLEEFTEIFDFHTAQQRIREATEAFNALPADVRLRFSNDPGLFVEFASSPDNAEELLRMGLADRRKPPTADPQPDSAVADPTPQG